MFKKIINPKQELEYRQDGIDNKYLINEGSRAIGLFAMTKDQQVPAQLSMQDICFYVIEGALQINAEEKTFLLEEGNLLLIPKSCAYTLKVIENVKILTVRLWITVCFFINFFTHVYAKLGKQIREDKAYIEAYKRKQ